MTGPHESAYGRDTRVQWPTDGWEDNMLAYLPDTSEGGNDRMVMVAGGGYTVRGWHNPDASIFDPSGMYMARWQIFSTVDEAIAAVLGEPFVSVLTVEEIAAATAAGMPAGWQIECRVFLRRHLEDGTPWQAVAWVVWRGGFAELHTWPWDADGLLSAGQWGVGHAAVREGGFPIRRDDELLAHLTIL